MSRSTRQYAAHVEAGGSAAPRLAGATGHSRQHLRPLGTDAQSSEGAPPPAGGPEVSTAALRGVGELLRASKARHAADERLAVTLTLGELRELVRDAALEAVADAACAPRPALLDRSGLAQALGVGTSTVDRFRREGCPVLWVGDSPRFEIEPCLAWLRGRGQP